MLSKNFEYTGHFLYLPNISPPMSEAPSSATASRRRKRWPFEGDVAEAFVGHATFVGGFGGAGEPAFVDAAAVGAVGVVVAGVELDAAAWMEEAARHPGGREAQEPLGRVERLRKGFADVVFGYNGRDLHRLLP